MAFAHCKSTSFLLLSHIPSLLYHLMYINKRRFAENNREKSFVVCANSCTFALSKDKYRLFRLVVIDLGF